MFQPCALYTVVTRSCSDLSASAWSNFFFLFFGGGDSPRPWTHGVGPPLLLLFCLCRYLRISSNIRPHRSPHALGRWVALFPKRP